MKALWFWRSVRWWCISVESQDCNVYWRNDIVFINTWKEHMYWICAHIWRKKKIAVFLQSIRKWVQYSRTAGGAIYEWDESACASKVFWIYAEGKRSRRGGCFECLSFVASTTWELNCNCWSVSYRKGDVGGHYQKMYADAYERMLNLAIEHLYGIKRVFCKIMVKSWAGGQANGGWRTNWVPSLMGKST